MDGPPCAVTHYHIFHAKQVDHNVQGPQKFVGGHYQSVRRVAWHAGKAYGSRLH